MYVVRSTLCVVIKLVCVVIPIYFMYHILNFYIIPFLKFIVHKINSKIVKSEMVKLTERRLI
jgi:type III secretory pathway component EscS